MLTLYISITSWFDNYFFNLLSIEISSSWTLLLPLLLCSNIGDEEIIEVDIDKEEDKLKSIEALDDKGKLTKDFEHISILLLWLIFSKESTCGG